MGSNSKTKNSNSRTRRNSRRAEAYRNSNKSQTKTTSQNVKTQTKKKAKPSVELEETKVIKTNIKPVETKKETIDKQKEKERQEQIIKQEQKFKEEQKKRIDELIEHQKKYENKTKEIESKKRKRTPEKATIIAKDDEFKTETIIAKDDEFRAETVIAKDDDFSKKPIVPEEPIKKETPKRTTTRQTRSTQVPKSSNTLTLDDFTAKGADTKTPHIDINNLEDIELDLETPPEKKNSSISKSEEQDLLDRLNKINELELTNRINKLTKEALESLESQAADTPSASSEELAPVAESKEEPKSEEVKEKVEDKQEEKTKPKKGKKFLILILLISIGVFAYATFNIVKWQIDNNNTKDITDQIDGLVDVKEVPDGENVEIIGQDGNVPQSDPYWDYIKVPLIDVDFNELNKVNNETVGWIQVMGTNINYPFVQTKNNSYYLSHSFDKSKNSAGWVFMDYRNNVKQFDRNNIIYAHGRLDTTMFGSLKNILTSGWLTNKENYVIRLSTEYENTLWQVFSVYRIKTTNDYIKVTFADDKEFGNFVNMLKSRSAHNFNTTVKPTDKILTLSTCYNQTDKVVLHAKLIKRDSKS